MSTPPSRRRWVAALAASAVVATPLSVLGVMAPAHAAPVDIQILGTNDFHGRILPNNAEAGAAQFAGAVAQLESQNPNTVFAAAGDLIGASTFESMIQHDKPTLDALSAAGLDVSAAGNHEFDMGYRDLVERVMAPFDATSNPEGGAEWQYLAANVRKKSDNSYALPDVAASPGTSDGATWMTEVAGVQVGFVGAVTEDLPSLVSADALSEVVVTDIVDEVNAGADALTAAGADVVVMLVHEGAATTDISALSDGSAFAQIVNGVDGDVDAIISGHTHLAYAHDYNGRPVVSSGQYGTNLNKLVFTVDPATGSVAVKENTIVAAAGMTLGTVGQAKKAEVQKIVDDAKAQAEVLGARELGTISAPFNRAKLANGSENRGGESTLGNLVAEVQRWATSTPEAGGAQIAFMNPGGLRADMGSASATYPATVTYKEAAVVQPFANNLINMRMTGAQIKTVLEQQWQRDKDGKVPSRPFLRLGTSAGFVSTFDASRPEGDRITGMWLNGTPIGLGTTYSVTANAFLASGTGDNFWGFAAATGKRDTGKVDLQAMVDYMAAFGSGSNVVSPDYSQHQVGASLAPEAPAAVRPGERVRVDVSSWSFSTAPDLKDTEVEVLLDGTKIDTAPVDNSLPTAISDVTGQAVVDALIPMGTPAGSHTLSIVGPTTGTRIDLPVQVDRPALRADAVVDVRATPATIKAHTGTSTLDVTVSAVRHTPTGMVAVLHDGEVIGGGELIDGKASIPVGPFGAAGEKGLVVRYYGDLSTKPASGSTSITVEPAPVVEKAAPTVSVTADPTRVRVMRDESTLSVSVDKASGTATGAVLALVDGEVVGAGELSDGSAKITLQPFRKVGPAEVTVKYFGDDSTKAASTTATVKVVKARPRIAVKKPKVVRKGVRTKVVVRVSAFGYRPTGKVTMRVNGKKITRKIRGGKVTFRVRLNKVGRTRAVIRYRGDTRTRSGKRVVKIRVLR